MQSQNGKNCFDAGIEIGPDGEPTGKIICYPNDNCRCIVVREPKSDAQTSTGFLTVSEPTPFHDEVLIRATQEMNAVLTKMARETKRDSRKTSLHVLLTDDGPMLVWVDAIAAPMKDVREFARMKSW